MTTRDEVVCSGFVLVRRLCQSYRIHKPVYRKCAG